VTGLELPGHVVSTRRDGRRVVLLHRSMAVIAPDKVEIKAARGTLVLPAIGLALAGGLCFWMVTSNGEAPIWALAGALLFCLILVPASAMSLVSSIAGADVVVDGGKGSATWQQGYLGMGIGTRELVPFEKVDHLEIEVEGAEPDRWRGNADSIRQFAVVLVKKSGKRLNLANVPVAAEDQTDGMDRAMAVAQAVAAIASVEVKLPEGWELVEVDAATLEPVPTPRTKARKGRRR
jgi:hypothetical protein